MKHLVIRKSSLVDGVFAYVVDASNACDAHEIIKNHPFSGHIVKGDIIEESYVFSFDELEK